MKTVYQKSTQNLELRPSLETIKCRTTLPLSSPSFPLIRLPCAYASLVPQEKYEVAIESIVFSSFTVQKLVVVGESMIFPFPTEVIDGFNLYQWMEKFTGFCCSNYSKSISSDL